MTKGELRNGTLDNVQWHANGSFYIKSGHLHLVNFQSELMSSKWNELWGSLVRSERMRKINEELAVSIQLLIRTLRLTPEVCRH